MSVSNEHPVQRKYLMIDDSYKKILRNLIKTLLGTLTENVHFPFNYFVRETPPGNILNTSNATVRGGRKSIVE